MRSSRMLGRLIRPRSCPYATGSKRQTPSPSSKPASNATTTETAAQSAASKLPTTAKSATPTSSPTGSSSNATQSPKPASSGAGSTPSGGTQPAGNGKNQWLLHPLVPVDVRLLGTGVLGIAAVYFYSTSMPNIPPKPVVWDDPEPDQASNASMDTTPAEETLDQADAQTHHIEKAEAEPSPSAPERKHDNAKHVQTLQGEDTEEHPHIAADSEKVVSLLNEALGASAFSNLHEAVAAVQASVSAHSKDVEEQKPGPSATESADQTDQIDQKVAPDVAAAEWTGSTADLQGEQPAAVPSPKAPLAGEIPPIFAPPSPVQVPAQQAAAPAAPKAPEEPPPSLPSGGVQGDPWGRPPWGANITAALLIQKSNQLGLGSGENWVEFKHRQKQAEADVEVVKQLMAQLQEQQQALLGETQTKLRLALQFLNKTERQMRMREAEFSRVLMEQRAMLEEKREAELELLATQLEEQHSQQMIRERVQRTKETDEVRLHVDALADAFSRRSEERKSSHIAHKVAISTFALEGAIQSGRPFAAELQSLAVGSREDPVVKVVLASLPQGWVQSGVPTEKQIFDRFQGVKRVASELALVPQGAGGLLTAIIAKLASKLKVKESVTQFGDGNVSGISAALALAEAKLVQGSFLEAASIVENGVKGTAAARQVQGWLDAVHARAAADQAVQLLQARAVALTASLS